MNLLVFVLLLAAGWIFVLAVQRSRKKHLYIGVTPPIVEFLSTELNRFPLHQAVFQNDFHAVDKLLKQSYRLDMETDDGQTPLHAAAACQNGIRVIKTLVAHGADVRLKDVAGLTPCAVARKYKHYKIAAYLKLRGS